MGYTYFVFYNIANSEGSYSGNSVFEIKSKINTLKKIKEVQEKLKESVVNKEKREVFELYIVNLVLLDSSSPDTEIKHLTKMKKRLFNQSILIKELKKKKVKNDV